MPIAFDPPTHAPHGTLPTRGARSVEDDPATLDIFTQLLLSAASVQDAAAPPEPSARATRDDAATPDASVLCLPLPLPLQAGQLPAASTVTIVSSEKILDTRGTTATDRSLVDALRTTRAGDKSAASAAPSAGASVAAPAGPQVPGLAAATASLNSSIAAACVSPAPAQSGATSDAAPAKPVPAALATTVALTALVAPIVSATDKLASAKSAPDSASATALQALAASAQTPPAPVHVETISAPAFTPGWQDETVNKLAQIVLTKNERAELKLNPAELGPVNVRVELKADQVSVQIVAASPETRSALEQSLPQLRDLLASQGITLGQASVHDGTAQRDARTDAWPQSRATTSDAPATGTGRSDAVHLVARRPDRLVDIFA
jgi:flagellar hook-length control protein FliK